MARPGTWISILIAGIAIVGILCLVVVGGSVYWVAQHIDARFTSNDSAGAEIDGERVRFSGQQPLVEIRPGEDPIVHRTAEAGLHPGINGIHALFYDPRARKLIRANFPFWMMRVTPRGQLSFFSGDSEVFGDFHLTLQDLERRGPGLVLDAKDVPIKGGQALIWTD
jgi:hypothetical protein